MHAVTNFQELDFHEISTVVTMTFSLQNRLSECNNAELTILGNPHIRF